MRGPGSGHSLRAERLADHRAHRRATGLTRPPPAIGRRASCSASDWQEARPVREQAARRPAPEWSLGARLRARPALIGRQASGRALSARPSQPARRAGTRAAAASTRALLVGSEGGVRVGVGASPLERAGSARSPVVGLWAVLSALGPLRR